MQAVRTIFRWNFSVYTPPDHISQRTNNIAQDIIKYYPDGFVYPSVNSFDTVISGIRFVLDETEMYNVALTEQGYNKIYEHKPIEYKNKGLQEEKHFTAEELLKDNE